MTPIYGKKIAKMNKLDSTLISVEEAENIILDHLFDFGNETLSLDWVQGRVLAEKVRADRDLPPFNRSTMDGIAIKFEDYASGIREFTIKGIQAAGAFPLEISNTNECIEVMTGAAISSSQNAVIPYESLEIKAGKAVIKKVGIQRGQYIHKKGRDCRHGDVLVKEGHLLTTSVISLAATLGIQQLRVRKNPKVLIITTGDEIVPETTNPGSYQVRNSNKVMLYFALKEFGIESDTDHFPDQSPFIEVKLKSYLGMYDSIILSGGVSKGKFDYIPRILEKLGVQKRFHRVNQRPGKPFWFGDYKRRSLIFAFPGNPVSTFLCFIRYWVPWYNLSMGLHIPKKYAILDQDLKFEPRLQYFLQVSIEFASNGNLIARPIAGNGSGDFANLVQSNAFLELPLERSSFKKGEVFPVWIFGS